jgi:hypothetical protein
MQHEPFSSSYRVYDVSRYPFKVTLILSILAVVAFCKWILFPFWAWQEQPRMEKEYQAEVCVQQGKIWTAEGCYELRKWNDRKGR